jgi:hypothetical protein
MINVTLPLKNVALAERFNSSKENGNVEATGARYTRPTPSFTRSL